MVNKVTLVGNVAKVESRSTVVFVTMATNEKYKTKEGEDKEITEWHRCAFFGKSGEQAQKLLEKGSLVYIEGKLHYSQYEKDNIVRYSTDINVIMWKLLRQPTKKYETKDGMMADEPITEKKRVYGEKPPMIEEEDEKSNDLPF